MYLKFNIPERKVAYYEVKVHKADINIYCCNNVYWSVDVLNHLTDNAVCF